MGKNIQKVRDEMVMNQWANYFSWTTIFLFVSYHIAIKIWSFWITVSVLSAMFVASVFLQFYKLREIRRGRFDKDYSSKH